ncbi:MAG TPA: protease modulator HflC [bacterium]|jgi:membrane protease subunit HflC|nr:protease modulator HflC [bacterium]HOX85409.1 protease modulator HflC [bacterium]HPG44568.1 protease modulator HflC [bacterium]HPM97126.1 protease modulator HflC [bacterium]
MNAKTSRYVIVAVIILLLILLSDTFYIVDETHLAIITQFGDPIGDPVTTAGLKIKMPFIQKATFFEKRIIQWDGDPNQIPTSDKKYILVDTFARWRIVDPLKFYQSVNNERNAHSRLDDIIDGITRDFISEKMLIEVVRNSNRELTIASEGEETPISMDSLRIEKGRLAITRMILEQVQKLTPQYGLEVLDMRIKQVNYIEEVQVKVFDRMISERRRIAELYRSEGQGKKAEIEGQMQKELQRINSEAYRKAQQIQGKADAEATEIYADAFSRDPEFYSFLRTLESYRNSLDSSSTLILSTDGEYLKFLKSY